MAQAESIPLPPGGAMEIVFSFDTTGSMGQALTAVQRHLQDTVTRLFSDIPALRIAIFAHSDYCGHSGYVTKYVDFTNDIKTLSDFVKNCPATCGCDYEECYELVLKETRENLSWSPATQRILVMIGDAMPHPKNYRHANKKGTIDWKEEAKFLKEMVINFDH